MKSKSRRRIVTVNDKFQKVISTSLADPLVELLSRLSRNWLRKKCSSSASLEASTWLIAKKNFRDLVCSCQTVTKISHDTLNYFHKHASQPLKSGNKSWSMKSISARMVQWYCRYYMGRRIAGRRWASDQAMEGDKRHITQLIKNCKGKTWQSTGQRQAFYTGQWQSKVVSLVKLSDLEDHVD